jgi:carbon-monoxide dehydrogenase large subunit
MTKSTREDGIGQPVIRKEDAALVTGQGRFSDDLDLVGQAYAVMVRSPHAHARIRAIDAAAALALPGVVAVLTGADALADGLKPIPHRPLIGPPDIALGKPDTSDKFLWPHRVLPHDKARFAGEAVAMVIAESVSVAKDAAERVRADFEPLPAVTDTVAAAAAHAPRIWDEAASNVCIDALVGDAATTASAFARAAHVVKLDTWIQRVTGVPLEPRAAVGSYDAASGRTTLYAGSGGVVRQARARRRSRRPAAERPGGVRRRRRQFRHPQRVLPRIRAGSLGVATHWPPRQMDLRTSGSLSQRLPGARSFRQRRAGAR